MLYYNQLVFDYGKKNTTLTHFSRKTVIFLEYISSCWKKEIKIRQLLKYRR